MELEVHPVGAVLGDWLPHQHEVCWDTEVPRYQGRQGGWPGWTCGPLGAACDLECWLRLAAHVRGLRGGTSHSRGAHLSSYHGKEPVTPQKTTCLELSRVPTALPRACCTLSGTKGFGTAARRAQLCFQSVVEGQLPDPP